mmetsp:Transcript_5055/g.14112  ORF Transcript_5055/g.14112 Transcript_5055/m.14112 type:complete len:273 (-) Transcript_5055:647-1465(-)
MGGTGSAHIAPRHLPLRSGHPWKPSTCSTISWDNGPGWNLVGETTSSWESSRSPIELGPNTIATTVVIIKSARGASVLSISFLPSTAITTITSTATSIFWATATWTTTRATWTRRQLPQLVLTMRKITAVTETAAFWRHPPHTKLGLGVFRCSTESASLCVTSARPPTAVVVIASIGPGHLWWTAAIHPVATLGHLMSPVVAGPRPGGNSRILKNGALRSSSSKHQGRQTVCYETVLVTLSTRRSDRCVKTIRAGITQGQGHSNRAWGGDGD